MITGNAGRTLLDAATTHFHQDPSTKTDGRRGAATVDLNPAFVEALMGFPADWTDCDCSETPSCQPAQKSSDTSSGSSMKRRR